MSGFCPVSGKAQHATANAATKALKGHGSVFRCDHCHQWHHSRHTDKVMDRHSRADFRRRRKGEG
jgi:pyruvate-formate lyase-activating enzyme